MTPLCFQGPIGIEKDVTQVSSRFPISGVGVSILISHVQRLSDCWTYHCDSVHPSVIMGSSREIAIIAATVVLSLLLGGMLCNEIDPKHKYEYHHLAFATAFFAGITQLGFFRLGFLIDFLSNASSVGFMAGAATMISLQQLKGLLDVET